MTGVIAPALSYLEGNGRSEVFTRYAGARA